MISPRSAADILIQNTVSRRRNAVKGNRFADVVGPRRNFAAGVRRSASTAASPPPPSLLTNPLLWYASKLDTHPLTTKCLTSGAIAGAGDVLCQRLARSPRADGATEVEVEWPRTLRFIILGSCLVAPTVHAWFDILMTRFPGKGPAVVARRLFCDQGLFAPVFVPTFISCLTLLEHLSPDAVATGEGLASRLRTRLRDDVPETLVVGWAMWVPAMGVMFAVVPGKFQVLFSNSVGLFWNMFLSWRTHEGEERYEKGEGGAGRQSERERDSTKHHPL